MRIRCSARSMAERFGRGLCLGGQQMRLLLLVEFVRAIQLQNLLQSRTWRMYRHILGYEARVTKISFKILGFSGGNYSFTELV